jgi:hypothetical protein
VRDADATDQHGWRRFNGTDATIVRMDDDDEIGIRGVVPDFAPFAAH